jgi:hypothetical protein
MKMNRINFLPPWVETNCQPAFYDKESGTVLQQNARMYAKVNQLVRNVNEQNEAIELYIAKFIELRDYVHDYFDNLDVQEEINNKLDDMAEDGPFGPKLFETPYTLVDYEGAEKGSFESYLQEEKELPEAIWGENQPGWRLPTVEEWKELFKECESEWMLTQRNEVVCVLTGKNGKHITFKSLSKQRGFCSYWTGNSEQIGDFIDLDFRNGLVEFAEPYNNELWYHFVLNLDYPESNIRAVISPEVLK